ncbi:FAD-binding oxidoreductase [Streptomyces acidicola]|uniref:FAD-binding oxidoreductase n=1 Tax=Streptomyces acidicola TaxID=2596892 RepID=UPI00380B3F0C
MSASSVRQIPLGMSEQDFGQVLEKFTRELGADRVLTADEDRREFRDAFSYIGWEQHTASAIVMPTTVEEVQAVVRIANEAKVPLWAHGQGRNNGYGGAGPLVRGSVIVSLRKMNRVLEINEELGYAIVEPGVRWLDLYEEIQKAGHRLMVPMADIGWGSVVGNTLDNGVTYMPESFDRGAFCGMEVVLASGEVIRTGMGAMPGNKAWPLYKRSMGPSLDQLFTQSNFGIVTKMGYWLMPHPEVYAPVWIRAWKDDDLAPMIDTYRSLALDGTLRMAPQIMNTILLASVVTNRSQWHDGEGPVPERSSRRGASSSSSGTASRSTVRSSRRPASSGPARHGLLTPPLRLPSWLAGKPPVAGWPRCRRNTGNLPAELFRRVPESDPADTPTQGTAIMTR